MTDARAHPTQRRRSPVLAPFRVIRAHTRLFVCALIGAVAGLALSGEIRDATPTLIGWNIAVLLYLALSARLIARSNHDAIRRNARFQDEGRTVILLLASVTACASMGAIVAELGPVKNMHGWWKAAHLGLAVLTVLDSWLFIHLTFAFHYAHEYYLERQIPPEKKPEERGGLIFPGTETPQYIDFLYFSYVIGVASQTADVSTSSRTMRGLALVHGVLSFFYNTTILALTINIASGFV